MSMYIFVDCNCWFTFDLRSRCPAPGVKGSLYHSCCFLFWRWMEVVNAQKETRTSLDQGRFHFQIN